MKKIIINTLIAAAVLASVSCNGVKTDYYFYDAATMQAKRKAIRAGEQLPAYDKLITIADSLLNEGPWSVMDKGLTPPSGSKHDYMSQGPYWWPDPEKPDGLPYIRRDGQTNPEVRDLKDATMKSRMISVVDKLALAYYFSGDEKYASKAINILRVWFLDEATKMNPNLNYSQRIPGICDGRGIGIIDSKGFVDLLQSVQLLEESKNWTDADDKGLKAWFREFRDWLLTSSNGKDENTQPNNHGTSYDLQVSLFSIYCGDPEPGIKHMNDTTYFRFDQIDAEGCQPREMARTKSWSYSNYNLRMLTQLAQVDERLGNDYWHYVNVNGSSLRDAYEYMFEVVRGEREWPGQNIDSPVLSMGGLAECTAIAASHYDKEYFGAMFDKIIAYPEKPIDPSAQIWSLTYPVPSK